MPPNKEQRERLKGWFKLGKELRDRGPNSVKRVLNPEAILESYAKGTVEIHYHIWIRTGSTAKNPQKFCVRLNARRHGWRGDTPPELNALNYEVGCPNNSEVQVAAMLGEHRFDFSVLVPTYKGVEGSKGVVLFDCEPMVRLVTLDDCSVFSLDTGQPSVDLPFNVFAVSTDDELGLTGAPEFRLGPPTNKVVGEVVEGGAEIRERVPNYEAPLGWRAYDTGDGNREAIQVRIEFFPHHERQFRVGVEKPGTDVSLERVHVFLRPVEFVPTSLVQATHEV